MGSMKTPGVYIVEKNAFPNSVVEAPTAIPAFIGYTEKAVNGTDDLTNIPWKISSMTEYIQYFGEGPELKFTVDIKKYNPDAKINDDGSVEPTNAVLKPKPGIFQYSVELKGNTSEEKNGYAFCIDGKNKYTLYWNMMLFFANGGGTCYVVSVGNYGSDTKDTLDDKKVGTALDTLKKIQEVTMIIVPEAVENDTCTNIQQLMLKHCGEMANRFTILDMPPKYPDNSSLDTRVETFQGDIGSNYMSYGAAYFPWLNTTVLGDRDLTGDMFIWTSDAYTYRNVFSGIDPAFSKIVEELCKKFDEFELKEGEVKIINNHTFKFDNVAIEEIKEDGKNIVIGTIDSVEEIKEEGKTEPNAKKVMVTWEPPFYNIDDQQTLHQALLSGSILYPQAMKAVKKYLNLLPPSAAMAGIYTMVDNSRGVWKAPANVTLNYVDSVTEDIDDGQQAGLNVPMNGKVINVIRPFRGEGIKVWGARTLDGNSLDWRYISVRRTLLFLEESVKNAARAYVFEPNDAGTWINMQCMIESFLRSVWKRGGLAGATPEDAFSVHVGLGDTMTADDILEGIMRITVLVAVTHPAEFIEITFQQQMQKS